MQDIIKKLGIKDVFTERPKKQKVFNHVKNNIPMVKGYNYEADILYLPTTKDGYKYILAMVDLADNSFDIQPLKQKDAKTVLEGYKAIVNRKKYLEAPKISLRTDAGPEFKGVFNTYLGQNKIIHFTTLPNRHKQMGNVESLNRQLGRIYNLYMNKKEVQNGEVYNEWDDITQLLRDDLNKARVIDLKDYVEHEPIPLSEVFTRPAKFKVGDMVHRKLDTPRNALGHDQPTNQFREGDIRYDTLARKIKTVIYMTDEPFYRYMLTGIPRASYCEAELIGSQETDEKYIIEKIIKAKKVGRATLYLVKWKDYPISEATWEPEKEIIKDIGKPALVELLGHLYKAQKILDERKHENIKQYLIQWYGAGDTERSWEDEEDLIKDVGRTTFNKLLKTFHRKK